ncbi:MAG: nodulation protein NfeD [Gammaproteobacteria bacterium]|nr:nodulation protein NfeD [Gammaproteobacteria bacterium]
MSSKSSQQCVLHGSLPEWFIVVLLLMFSTASPAQDVWLVELKGPIGPASADFVIRSLENAAEAGAELVVLRIDTPGGLDLAMRDIIRNILSSSVPVAGWVAPNGARAASAGTYIMYASHFAAMSLATNIGSSTPVNLGGGDSPLPIPISPEEPAVEPGVDPDESTPFTSPTTAMERKVLNDAVAYIKGLAELRGRNADWAELTVVEAANLPASEALALNVIDLIANDIDELLSQLNGRTTLVDNHEMTLSIDDPNVILVEPDWRHQFLAVITNPNVAYILLMIGIYGLILEFYNPGMGLPGITGVICLLLGAFALQMLPINYAGLALIIVGMGLMVVEALSPSFGVFGLGGVVAFVLGSIILMDTDLDAYRISIPIIAAFAVASAGVFFYALGAVISARKQRVTTGREAMIGSIAVATENFESTGHVRAFSENWSAKTSQPVSAGEQLRIIAVEGLILKVRPTKENSPDTPED